MQIIISHVNTDFDALSSMIAAKKLHPNAQLVISTQQDNRVRRFLNIYRDTFDFIYDHEVEWEKVTYLILVDVASLNRIGQFSHLLNTDQLHVTVYDHHPVSKNDVEKDAGLIEQVGATVTLLTEKIKTEQIEISPFEATVFGLGIYTDTGAFTFKNTTVRDFHAAGYLMEQGMDLEIIQQFSEQTLQPDQQALLDTLFENTNILELNGVDIAVSKCHIDHFVRDLATITTKLLDIKGVDAIFAVVGMKKDVFVVGRARSNRISLQPLLKQLGGGGHKHAGSATIKKANFEAVYEEVTNHIDLILQPAVTAKDIMTSPVKTIAPETTIEKAGQLMYRYGHSGYPVVDDDTKKLVGIITRRDLDKANHHGLGHAPVKAYMTTNIMTVSVAETLEQIQQKIINHNIGRLPVIKDEKIVGIISRTNIIEAIHGESLQDDFTLENENELKTNVKNKMNEQLPDDIYSLLIDIGKVANKSKTPVYLIGGIVRDLFLNVPNDDVDIVVEGDGIDFVKDLQKTYGGELIIHESFGTATWIHPSGQDVDIASSRLEYYDKPASLPDVETSTLTEDLNRRDFTINAIGIYLNEDQFGHVIDPFAGQLDLREKKIKVLHNISFVEDPTRLFRAIRFETRFNFLMDKQTETLAIHSIAKVKQLSAERIINEMKRLFIEEDPLKVMRRLYELTFWQQYSLNESSKDLSCHLLNKLKKHHNEHKDLFLNNDLIWFQQFIIPFFVDDQLSEVERFAITKQDAAFLREVTLLKEKRLNELDEYKDIHRVLKDYSSDVIMFSTVLQEVKDDQLILDYLRKRKDLQPLVTGHDLQEIGLKPSPLYSEIFFNLEVLMLTGEVASKEAAIDWIQQFTLEKSE